MYYVTRTDYLDILIHSGVKGMKWGKWNAETAARYSAKNEYGKQSAYYKAKSKQVDKITKKADDAVAKYKANPTKQNEKAAIIAENKRNMAQLDLMGTKTNRKNIRYSNIRNAYGAVRKNGRTYYDDTVENAAKFRRRMNIAGNTLGLVGSVTYMAAAKQGREAYTRYLTENSRINRS